jgi:trigger factor
MIKEKTIEHLEQSAVKLSITVESDHSKKAYTDLITTYTKKAHLKGFRPGKAPAKVIETKFGESIRMEAAQQLIEDALKTVFEEIEEAPLGYSQPQLESQIDYDPEKEFSFAVSYDIFPKFEVSNITGITIEEPQVTIDKEDLDRELDGLREQNALVVEKNEGPAAKGDIITVNYWEVDSEGNEIPGTKREDYTFTIGTGYSPFQLDEDVIGMTVGEQKQFSKTEDERTFTLLVTITKKKVKELPELDDDLAQDIDEAYKTVDDLKKSIQQRLEDSASSQVRQKKVSSLLNGLREQNPISVPKSMIQAELHSNWNNFIRQFGGNEDMVHQLLRAQGSSQEQLFQDWSADAENRIKGQLILHKLVEQESIEVSDDEINEEIRKQAQGSSMSEEEAREYFEKNNYLDYVKRDIQEKKMIDLLFEKNTVKKGKKVKYLDLMNKNE